MLQLSIKFHPVSKARLPGLPLGLKVTAWTQLQGRFLLAVSVGSMYSGRSAGFT